MLRLDPSLIELTDFCDKHTIIKKLLGFSSYFNDDLSKIEKVLRNPLAHGRTFVTTNVELEEFTAIIECVQKWTQELNQYLSVEDT